MNCIECGREIEKEYLTVLDNFLQVKYFEEIDGSDNIFCSEECLMKALSVEWVFLEDKTE